MDLKILFGLALYWTLISLVFGLASVDSFGNPLVDDGYSASVNINDSGFSEDEFDTDTGGFWGFFSGIAGVFTAMLRIIGFYAFGITSVLTGATQIIFSAFQTLISIITIGFIISAFWNG